MGKRQLLTNWHVEIVEMQKQENEGSDLAGVWNQMIMTAGEDRRHLVFGWRNGSLAFGLFSSDTEP